MPKLFAKFGLAILALLLAKVAQPQILQVAPRCAQEDNAQVFVTEGIAQLSQCSGSWSGEYQYKVVLGRSASESTVAIHQHGSQLWERVATLYWFESSPKSLHLKGSTGMRKLAVNELPDWALKIISDNRGVFGAMVAVSGIALPMLPDDPKARGRSARVM